MFFVCLLLPNQPWSHATQGMESSGCAQWMGPDPSKPTPKSRAVAKGFFAAPSRTSGRPTATFREGAKHRENRSRQYPSSKRSQSTSGGSSSGGCCGSAEVTVCHCSVGRQEPTRQTFEGSTESRAGQIQGAASGGQGGVIHVVHRTCPASRHTCRRGDQEGSGTTRGVRGGGRGGPAEVVVTAGRGGASTPSRGAGGGRIAEADRRIGQGTRPLASRVPHGSAQGWPKRMVRRQHPRFGRGASHASRSTRFGGLDQQSELEFGDASSIAKIGTLLSQGAALLASLSRDEPMDGKSRSSLFCHCASFQSRESGVRDARYGLRGTRVGEASHPGPRSDVPDDILDDPEVRLGRMDSDSDDEPLLRPVDGRNAVPRRAVEDVASSVPVTVDTVPADVESTMPISTVPASSGRVRATYASQAAQACCTT